jgi:hypothetical protein
MTMDEKMPMTPSESKDLLARVGVTVGIPAVLVLLGVLFGMCSGCAVGWPATCTDLALTEASVARGHGYDVRIVSGRDAEGAMHATGQALEHGEWRDLRFWDGDVLISYGVREVCDVEGVWDLGEYAGMRRRFAVDLKGE